MRSESSAMRSPRKPEAVAGATRQETVGAVLNGALPTASAALSTMLGVMELAMRKSASFLIVLCMASVALRGAEVAIGTTSAVPGAMVQVEVSFNSMGDQLSGLQFDLSYDQAVLMLASATIGAAADSAGKTLSTSVLGPGSDRFLIAGFNQNPIGDGTVAVLNFQVAGSAPDGAVVLQFSNATGADQGGQSTDLATSDGSITVMQDIGPPDAVANLIFAQYANGQTGETLNRTRIILRNNSDQSDSGSINFLDSSGMPAPVPVGGVSSDSIDFNIGPFGVFVVETDGSGDLVIGPIEVISDRGQDSRLEGTEVFELLGNFVSVASAAPVTAQQAFVSFGPEENTGVALFNPDPAESAELEFVLFDDLGQERARADLTLPARRQQAVFVNDALLFETFFSVNSEFTGTLNVFSDRPIALLGLLQRSGSGALIVVPASLSTAPRN